MEVFQVAHDLANDNVICHMKKARSFTHNVFSDIFICFLYYNNDDEIDLLYEMDSFNKLLEDFRLNKQN